MDSSLTKFIEKINKLFPFVEKLLKKENLQEKDTKKFLKTTSYECSTQTFSSKILYKEEIYHLYNFLKKNSSFFEEKNYTCPPINYHTIQNQEIIIDKNGTTQYIPKDLTQFVTIFNQNLVVIYTYDYMESEISICYKNIDSFAEFCKKYNEFCQVNHLYKNKKITLIKGNIKILPQEPNSFTGLKFPNGYEDEIAENVLNIFEKTEIYKNNHIPLKRGMILYGPPGTGKTSCVTSICSQLKTKVTIFIISSTSIDEANCISTLYTMARKLAPSLIVFEDIDLLGGNREESFTSSIIGELLNQMDGQESNELVVTLATTNYLEKIDSALSNRPSRFDRVLKFDLPDKELREEILKLYLNNYETENLKDKISTLAYSCNGYSGAQIKEVVISAALNMISEDREILTYNDLEIGINKVNQIFDKNQKTIIGF